MIGCRQLCILGIIGVARCLAEEVSLPASETTTSNYELSSKIADAVQGTDTQVSTASSSASALTGTCASRTINYVMQTLPQQCLRSDWSRTRNMTSSSTASVLSTVTLSILESPAAALLSDNGSTTASSTSTLDPTTNSQTSSVEASSSASVPEGRSLSEDDSSEASEVDSNSPLDTAHFLSFEDWKKQNLAKAGQSSEHLSARAPPEAGRKAPVNNALDTFGDENEIDLGFTGFGGPAIYPDSGASITNTGPPSATDVGDVTENSPAAQALRPRDAGRTCKERTNYASFDCAATVLKSNPECKSASSVLVENKDSYMLNKCSAANKFFIVELCNDILIDTIVLANYEFFSSIFRQFRVSVSDRYPVKAEKWKDLGTFEARNTREVQAFLVQNPLIWARYVRIEFLTHFGSEYYCPVSLLRVHGTTMMEEFRNQEELTRGDGDSVEDESIAEVEQTEGPDGGVMQSSIPTTTSVMAQSLHEPIPITKTEVEQLSTTNTIETADTSSTLTQHGSLYLAESLDVDMFSPFESTCSSLPTVTLPPRSEMPDAAAHDGKPDLQPTDVGTSTSATASQVSTTKTAIATHQSEGDTSTKSEDSVGTSLDLSQTTTFSSSPSHLHTTTPSISNQTSSKAENASTLHNSDASVRSNSTNIAKSSTSTMSSPQAQPPTQESFFKSISKRLQQLESNSTLSLQYIEEQSRMLRDAFSKVEKRQINMTTSFLSNLNKTVMAELAGFRQAYDQLWQSTVIELEGQREQHKHEMTALSSRLTLVVDELVWQKRMGIVQSTLLLLCLAMVLFGRSVSGASDASLMQQVMLRSQFAFKSGTGSEGNSPAGSRSPVNLFRRNLPLWRNGSAHAKNSDTEPQSAVASAPESPTSQPEMHVSYAAHQEYMQEDDADLSEAETFSDSGDHEQQ